MVTQPTPKHHFLRSLHELLKPATYLEIGVQSGTGMVQALPATWSIGVDPEPWGSAYARLAERHPNAQILPITSDEFFAQVAPDQCRPIDLAFIDGLHLIENVLRDFINVEERSAPGGVIVVDDVLPYSPDIAVRTPLPGDWTGDVWKLWPILARWRPDLGITMVDVDPTGLMVVQGLDPVEGPGRLRGHLRAILTIWANGNVSPREWVSDGNLRGRPGTYSPDEALKIITDRL